MWEPGAGSNGSTTNTNRGIILLLSVCVILIILYKAWGPLLLITFALVLVVHTCYSLLVNDSLLAPNSLLLLNYASQLGLELLQTIKLLAALGFNHSVQLFQSLKQWYRQRQASRTSAAGLTVEEDMNRRPRNVYRLSTGGSELPEGISPINNDPYHSFALNGASTSTPLARGVNLRKGIQQNGEIGLFTPIVNSPAKKLAQLQLRSENKQPVLPLPRPDETHYSPKGSPWGNNISPKMKDRTTVKTVQTVAGPLLTSSRYNIDPKTYTDINSPGLTSRLNKYAAEANSRLTHQPQYGTGQFPKVNLNATSVPLLSPKVARARIPVTVRVAPPEVVNYSPTDAQSQQERHKMYSGSEAKESQSCPNVAQVLKKISLKRHASREDIMFDLAKKQRAERIYVDQLENLEEMMQKRARDDSMTSDDDLSPQSKNQRPLKRSKASSCHDILNSLSSSINVFTGVKRKAMDTSRCNTPDIEKHFKPSSRSPNRSSSLTLHSSGDSSVTKEQLNVKVPVINASGEPHQMKVPEKSPETSKTDSRSSESQKSFSPKVSDLPTPKLHRELSAPSKPTNLTEKLFMKPEPQNTEKLKNLIEEQGNVEVKFTTDDKDEIKKQDIVNMRQNSMRLRLQSMFDAISGKSASKIDPDVVIQAEEVRPSVSTNYTSLNSQTTTTTVNTSPITTTIVPILKDCNEQKSPNAKHVTFNLPSASSSFSSTASTLSNKEATKTISKPVSESQPLGGGISTGFGGFSTASSTISSSAPSFNFGTSSLATSTTSASSLKPASTGGFSFTSSTLSSSAATAPTSKLSSPETKTTATTASTNISSSLFAPKSTAENLNTTTVISSSGFSFGNTANSTTATTMPSAPTISFGSMANTASKSTESNTNSSTLPTFGNPLAKSPASISITQPTSTMPSFTAQKKEVTGGFSFGAQSSSLGLGSTATSTTSATSQPASLFGMPAASTPMFSLGSNATTTASSSASLPGASTAATTTPAPSIFGIGSGATAKPTTCFSFKPIQSTPTSASTTPSSSGFGAPTLNTASSIGATATFAAPAASNTMGSPAVSGFQNNTHISSNSGFASSTPSLFGAPTNSPSLFSGAASTSTPSTSMFKPPATTTTSATPTNSIFGTPSGAMSSFGAQPTATTANSTPTLFGAGNATPSLFGNAAANPATTTSSTPTMSAFGGTGPQQQQTPQGGGIFSGVNMSAATGTNSIFGSANATPTGGLFSGGTNTSSASTNLTTAASPAESTSIFGQSKPAASLSFGGTNPTFGTTQATSSFSAPNSSGTSTFQLGGTTAPSSTSGGLPSFSIIKPSPQFGATSNAPATSGSSIFGSSSTNTGFGSTAAPPAFGSTTPASGAQTSAFGMQNSTSAAAPAFGAPAATSSSFGGGATTTSPFGAPTTTNSTTLFGNAAPAASSSSSFSFGGGSQQTQQPAQQPTASFSFGGATNTNAASSGGLFQFGGASTAPKPAGFNFNAPTAAPTINFTGSTTQGAAPAFNAPPANMFSIGSGSTTPRTRPSRARRQR
ncbi:nuclear pore complex protein DDB_G0274915 isoform X1 [Nasonia vitripennis]|uniref:Uncharacterized protein n=1 Tax=Nasonia vitripennis TaxID=7425 RepID=A0A7M7TAN5_NASVI|nr:nuclear pore complex protein DDB_G0274915 isoform X1 [Nasonia vitripennis]